MPISAAQATRVLSPDLIPASRVADRPTRIVESWLRRRLFAVEDFVVSEQAAQFKTAYRALRATADDLGEGYGVGRALDNSRASRQWRDATLERVDRILTSAYRTMMTAAAEWATQAYAAGFYGRLWLLDEMTTDAAPLVTPTLSRDAISRAVLAEQMGTYDPLVLDLLGQEWTLQYQFELDDLLLRIRRAFNQGMRDGLGIRDVMRLVADNMGVDIDRRNPANKANFNRIQTITRTVFNKAQNDGAVAAYEANERLLQGYQWLTARDERVCTKICLPLDGQEWTFDDPTREQPPAHPNCRCAVIPVIRDDWARPVERIGRPKNSFSDFLLSIGMAYLLQEFLQGRRLDSERV